MPFHGMLREELTARGLAPRSVEQYIGAMARADRWLRKHCHKGLRDATALELSAYCAAAVPETWSSRKLARSALTAYFEILELPTKPVGAVRVPPKPRFACRAREDDEAKRLADAAYKWDSGGEGVATLLGLYAALRRFEIAKVRWSDIDDGWLRIFGKGQTVNEIPLHPRVVERLEWWRTAEPDPNLSRTKPGAEFVFQGRYPGRPVTPPTIWDWVKKVAVEAGVKNLTTHQLRHTALATLNDRTGDLRGTQQFGRHADPATTVLYTRVNRDRLLKMVGVMEW